MQLEISTPQKTLFQGEVRSVLCPGKDGFFQILDHHAPMVAILAKGQVKYEISGDITPHFIEVDRGVLQVLNNKVTILSE
ncbi:MAG: F0F1 ATP synthase subunit epsilon [Bacteroidales bacterium]|jgi:F-type H+-transporting ATPase subunit epsilon|nr:F0F1 ATP synthase subunit epsilon [Bacteroidales bacterium]